MPIHLPENPYKGVNAHLHSFLQNEPGGWWTVFHNNHITDIRNLMDTMLPSGYYALAEKSLQIQRYDSDIGEVGDSVSRPDVGIYRSGKISDIPPLPAVDTPLMTVTVAETLTEEENNLRSVVIYKANDERTLTPVTRIELLSPSNKPPQSFYLHYLAKRGETLESGINLIEIDYLHQSASPVSILPSYPKRQKGAYPYSILVNNPHPSLEEGRTDIYVFRVNDPIPRIAIPLMGEEMFAFDFGAVYHQTFRLIRFFGDVAVDYEQLPIKFDSYWDEDKEQIQAVMKAAGG